MKRPIAREINLVDEGLKLKEINLDDEGLKLREVKLVDEGLKCFYVVFKSQGPIARDHKGEGLSGFLG